MKLPYSPPATPVGDAFDIGDEQPAHEIGEPPAAEQIDVLVDEAWELARQILRTGKCRLRGGKEMELDGRAFLSHVQWLANQRAKKPKSLALPKDVFLRATE